MKNDDFLGFQRSVRSLAYWGLSLECECVIVKAVPVKNWPGRYILVAAGDLSSDRSFLRNRVSRICRRRLNRKSRSVVPSFAKQAKLGQPQFLWCWQRWASPPTTTK